ncbi:hypothetical protein ASG59_18050 [Methylobacterium sp. Leaf466]|nr:hypothetical protein ASG59_18050 [Methylobacterium sp. Leaf466]
MVSFRSTAVTLSLVLLGAVSAAPALACTTGCEIARQNACLWDDACRPRLVPQRVAAARWDAFQPVALRAFSRMDVEAVRLFQRMP